MERLDVDLLVIGFGKAGKTLAAAVGRQGKRVALVEQAAAMYAEPASTSRACRPRL